MLAEFAKENELFVIKAGAMPNSVMSAQDVKALALLPSREELLAKLMGTMQAPVAKLVRTHERGAGQVRAHARRVSRLEGESRCLSSQSGTFQISENTNGTQHKFWKQYRKMTVLELSQLIKDMEEKFGVSAAAATVPWPARPLAAAPPRRQPRRKPSSP